MIHVHERISTLRAYATTHPIATFVRTIIPLSWIVLTSLFLAKLPPQPGILILNFLGLIGISTLITYWLKGRPGIYALFSGVKKWRVGITYYGVAIFAIPALTVLISLVTNTFTIPETQWYPLSQKFFISLTTGFIIINLWEETGWMAFMQHRLMQQKGILKGSLLTAPAFATVHMPLFFQQPTFTQFVVSFALITLLAFFFRYLLGMLYVDTNHSTFMVGLLHASFNASSSLGDTNFQLSCIAATIILTCIVHVYRTKLLHRSDLISL